MEPLNLEIHEAGEFEGKLVSVNGADYVIGAELGQTEKIVHKLFNMRSGLCVNVIKLQRDPIQALFWGERGRAAHIARIRRIAPEMNVTIPISLYFEAHGGPFEFQEFLNGYEYARETPATKALMSKGATLMDNSDYAGAKSAYAQILSENRFHTVALINLASAHAALGDYDQAREIASVAIQIEPNCILYRIAEMQYYGSAGHLVPALGMFERLRREFPYIHDADDYAIRVYLTAGDLDGAGKVLAEGMLSDKRLAELKDEVALAASAKARASVLAAQARDSLSSRTADDQTILRLLETAHKTYDKDPFVKFNLGLAAGRMGDYKRAIQLVFSTMSIMPLHMQKYVRANLAFNMIRVGMLAESMMMFEATLEMLTLAGTREVTSLDDLPGVAIWVSEESVIEERIQSAAQLVSYAIQNCPAKDAVTDGVKKLAALYRQAAAG